MNAFGVYMFFLDGSYADNEDGSEGGADEAEEDQKLLRLHRPGN